MNASQIEQFLLGKWAREDSKYILDIQTKSTDNSFGTVLVYKNETFNEPIILGYNLSVSGDDIILYTITDGDSRKYQLWIKNDSSFSIIKLTQDWDVEPPVIFHRYYPNKGN